MDSLAIVGYSCRFPGGANSPEKFWELLESGRDCVTEIPDWRWDRQTFLHPDPLEPGKSYTFRAGVIEDVDRFDAEFFGISPREAVQIDPQQRLLLELTWEALERGGIPPERLAGTACSVHIGISATDYSDVRQGDPESGDANFMTGSTLSIAANRISYVFDLRGPSSVTDTACSSALFALNDAWRVLHAGKAETAIVGAAHLLLSPYPFVGFSKAMMLSPHGQCRAFDANAEGYVRGEGGGVLVLKKLANAQRDNDTIFAVLRGVATNNDGRTKGITQPAEQAQEELLREVYRAARISPSRLSYLEAHGTGTSVGDPIEATAIGMALGQRRLRKKPLIIGSAKTNIGHLEPASGMVGLIKAIEVLRHGAIPASLHFDEPNPKIDFKRLNVRVAHASSLLSDTNKLPVVGVNSFGFGGANGHAILEAAPKSKTPMAKTPKSKAPEAEGVLPLHISARSDAGLRALAGALSDRIESKPEQTLYAVCRTAALGRDHHGHRAVVRADTPDSMISRLRDIAADAEGAGVTLGEAQNPGGRTSFVFSGNGAQWIGMGLRLMDEDPVFAATIQAVDTLVAAKSGVGVIDELRACEEQSRAREATVGQPLIFAVQAAIADSLIARGLVPDAVVGHSIGEVAAAYTACILTLEQAVDLVVRRSSIQERTRYLGGMAAAEIDVEEARKLIAPYDGKVEIAAINCPGSVTLTGDSAALAQLGEKLSGRRSRWNPLDLDYPFHSAYLDPHRDETVRLIGDLKPAEGKRRYYSSVIGAFVEGSQLGPEYWWDNMRQTVRLDEAIAAQAADGCTLFVEISPNAIMQSYVRRSLRAADASGRPIPTLRRDRDGCDALSAAVDTAYCAGAALDFAILFPAPALPAELPTYPWQRERYWADGGLNITGQVHMRTEGRILGARFARDLPVWQGQVDEKLYTFLADHVIGNTILFPAAGFAELALEAAVAVGGDGPVAVEELEIRQPLTLDATHRQLLRVETEEDGRIVIGSRPRQQDLPWTKNAVGRVSRANDDELAEMLDDGNAIPLRSWDAEAHYSFAAALGLSYGPQLRSVERIDVLDETSAKVALCVPVDIDDPAAYMLHPVLFDGGLQGLLGLLRGRVADDEAVAYLPVRIERLMVRQPGDMPASCMVRLVQATALSVVADFTWLDEVGVPVASAVGIRFQRALALDRSRPAVGYWSLERVPLSPAGAVPAAASPASVLPAQGLSANWEMEAALDRLSALFASEALHDVGSKDGAAANRVALLEHCLDITLRADLIDPESGEMAKGAAGGAEAAWRQFLATHPDMLAEATLVGRTGLHLAALLQGQDAAVARADAPTLELLMEGAPFACAAFNTLREAALRIIRAAPLDRQIRVVELDGTFMLPQLARATPTDRIDAAVLSVEGVVPMVDVGLSIDPSFERRVVDFAIPLGESNGWLPASVDLVVSVLRPGAPLDADTLGVIAGLLRPGGALLLSTPRPALWLDMVFGADERWWEVTEEGGWHSPVANADTWRNRLVQAGFADVECRVENGCYVLWARKSTALTKAERTSESAVLIVGDDAPEGLEGALANIGATAIRVPAFSTEEDWEEFWPDFAGNGDMPTLVVLADGLNADPADTANAQLARSDTLCRTATSLVRSLVATKLSKTPTLALLTNSGRDPAFGALRGLGRVMQNEYPELRTRLIDLDDGVAVATLADELLFGIDEDEVELGADKRTGLRLRPDREREEPLAKIGSGNSVLSFTPGNLRSLNWTARPAGEVPPGTVEIEVRAAGLNFRDVMFSMGLLPSEALENGFAGATLGMEAAGEIVRVGADVADLKPGDRVFCFAPQCFADRVMAEAHAVVPIPAEMDFAGAASIVTVFFTAWYALKELAMVEPGERVLIHGAAGGVGLAAIQIARHLGVEIYATAGSAEKRDIVRLMGVPEANIFSSRDGTFDHSVMRATGGKGVDVVLNSLHGEAISKGLRSLKAFGRFIELGKRDFYIDTKVGLRPFRKNISYFAIDADQLMAERPLLARRLLGELTEMFGDGTLAPLPRRSFAASDIVSAFRHMQQSRHIGKIVVAMTGDGVAQSDTPPSAAAFPEVLDGAVLVTGGTAGFGLATAVWLAERGTRDLVLVSRSGCVVDTDALARITATGALVDVRSCDVTDQRAVSELVSSISTESRRLQGVVHAAAEFGDEILPNLTTKAMHRVLAPKVAGAWALHEATQDVPLDFFVMFSSMATLFGNPGQASYVAANAYLDALAIYRQEAELPATSICWGPIADAGYLTRTDALRTTLESRAGIIATPAMEALSHMPFLVGRRGAEKAVSSFDLTNVVGRLPTAGAARYRDILDRRVSRRGDEPELDIERLIAESSPKQAKDRIVKYLAGEAAKVLHMPEDRINTKRSIFDLGMDSLMVVELMIGLEEAWGIKLPPIAAATDATLDVFADQIIGFLSDNTPKTDAEGIGEAEINDFLARHDENQYREFVGDISEELNER